MIETATMGRIARIAINRPEKRNALNAATCREILAAFDSAEADPAIGSILICGNGSAFCAGMDLQEALSADKQELADLHERLFTTIERARKPIVAAVHGAALAAGTGLVANAHIAIASLDARLGLTEIRIGLWPVIVFRAVARAIGERRATELSLTGRVFTGEEALRSGLITELAADSMARALEVAKTLSEFSPVATAGGLEYVYRARGLDWTAAAPIGHRIRAELMAARDFDEGVKAFLEKREPRWPSLRPDSS